MKKKMTQREKAERAAAKKRLQADGILPPDKSRLNYKKFCAEARALWHDKQACPDMAYIMSALTIVLGDIRPNAQTVGAAKVVLIAREYQRFEAEKRDAGESHYKISELFDRIKPILEA
jgi:hypothetical protein